MELQRPLLPRFLARTDQARHLAAQRVMGLPFGPDELLVDSPRRYWASDFSNDPGEKTTPCGTNSEFCFLGPRKIPSGRSQKFFLSRFQILSCRGKIRARKFF